MLNRKLVYRKIVEIVEFLYLIIAVVLFHYVGIPNFVLAIINTMYLFLKGRSSYSYLEMVRDSCNMSIFH